MDGVPMDAIIRGRDISGVLDAYEQIFDHAVQVSDETDADRQLADAMTIAAYRIYLLGVQDGLSASGGQTAPRW